MNDKQIASELRTYSLILTADSLPSSKELKQFLEMAIGATYPFRTLERRLKLLTPAEIQKVTKIWQRVVDLSEAIDEIISERASKANDPWP